MDTHNVWASGPWHQCMDKIVALEVIHLMSAGIDMETADRTIRDKVNEFVLMSVDHAGNA